MVNDKFSLRDECAPFFRCEDPSSQSDNLVQFRNSYKAKPPSVIKEPIRPGKKSMISAI